MAFRLTADLIQYAPHFLNPCNEFELDLRGNRLPAIENLGATRDQYDAIDLSNNEIQTVDGFPLLERLTSLTLNNNRVHEISPSIGMFLPNLTDLTLTGNLLRKLSDLNPLRSLGALLRLSLVNNPVTKDKNYRLYVIALNPRIRVLDYSKVKADERARAKEMYADGVPEAGAAAVGHFDADAPLPSARLAAPAKPKLTAEQIAAIRAAAKAAQTFEEVTRLENALRSGVMPESLAALLNPGSAAAAAAPASAAPAKGAAAGGKARAMPSSIGASAMDAAD